MFAVTPRLTLRPGWPEDAPALAAAIGHEAVARNLSRVPWPYTLDDARAFLALPCCAHEVRLQIRERSGQHRLIGGIALRPEGDGRWELGYWLTPEAWGRGYATEAGRAVLHAARHALGVRRISARHFLDNPASGGVLRKLGFRETARGALFSPARGGEAPVAICALDWSCDGAVDGDDAMPIAA